MRLTKEQIARKDQERIWAGFMQRMYSGILLGGDSEPFEGHDVKPREGDLVFLTAAPYSQWQLGRLIEIVNAGAGDYLIAALGTGELCNWTNVGVRVVRRSLANETYMLDGWRRRAYEKCHKAHRRIADFRYSFEGCRFSDKATITYSIRPHIFVADGHEPFDVTIPDADKLTIKRAEEAMREAGVGLRYESRAVDEGT